MFPSLRTDVPLVRRGPTEVQLGLDADGVVLTGLSPAEARTLAALDGSTPLDLLRRDSSRLAAALDELTERGLIVDAHRSAPAAGRRVAIDGQGATTRLLADLLAEAGVHVVHGPLVLDEIDLAARSGREPSSASASTSSCGSGRGRSPPSAPLGWGPTVYPCWSGTGR